MQFNSTSTFSLNQTTPSPDRVVRVVEVLPGAHCFIYRVSDSCYGFWLQGARLGDPLFEPVGARTETPSIKAAIATAKFYLTWYLKSEEACGL